MMTLAYVGIAVLAILWVAMWYWLAYRILRAIPVFCRWVVGRGANGPTTTKRMDQDHYVSPEGVHDPTKWPGGRPKLPWE